MQVQHTGHHHWYKTRRKKASLLDLLVIFVAIFGVFMTIPQIANVWIDKNVAGVSIYTWGAYAVGSLFWLLYGLYHNENIIVIPNVLGLLFNLLVVFGIMMYAIK